MIDETLRDVILDEFTRSFLESQEAAIKDALRGNGEGGELKGIESVLYGTAPVGSESAPITEEMLLDAYGRVRDPAPSVLDVRPGEAVTLLLNRCATCGVDLSCAIGPLRFESEVRADGSLSVRATQEILGARHDCPGR